MQNIAVFCKTLLKGGSEKQALMLSKLLSEKNKNVIVINWTNEKLDPEYRKFIENSSLRYFSLKGNPVSKYRQFSKIIKDEKITVILSYLTWPNFIAGISKMLMRKVITIGGIRNEKLPYHKFLFERWTHNNLSTASIFNNYSAKTKFIKRGFKSDNIYVIHNAIETSLISNGQHVVRDDIRLVTVSRFVEQKDFRTALDSFRKLLQKIPEKNITYYIVGYGPLEKEINQWAEEFKIADHVKVLINPADIMGILKSCDIYLSTSLFEGLSNSIMEAMVAGLPVVATNVGDNCYLIKDGLNGFLVPCRNAEIVAEKLAVLTESAEMRISFGEFSKNRIKEEFSPTNLIDNYLDLFSKIGLS